MNSNTLRWSVWNGGYEWIQGQVQAASRHHRSLPLMDNDEACLTHLTFNDLTYDEACQRFRARDYEPLEEQNLYEKFAKIDLTEDAVLAFVKQYGFLGEKFECERGNEYGGASVYCEPLRFWHHEVLCVRRIELLSNLIEDVEAKQQDAFLWKSPDHYVLPLLGKTFSGYLSAMAHLQPPSANTEAWLLRYHLLREINSGMRNRALVELVFNTSTFVLEPAISPKNLIGAIWLQVFNKYASGDVWKRCTVCGRFLDAQASRADAKYCSSACKQKAHRARKTVESGNT